jgi:hypothetical protein
MAHISTLGAGIYSDLAIHVPPTALTTIPTTPVEATVKALFATDLGSKPASSGAASFVRVPNVRSFPSIGAPANIINVASFGSKASKQINGQSDSPTIELTINYIPAEWEPATLLGKLIDPASAEFGKVCVVRFALLNKSASTFTSSAANGFGASVENSEWYWYGKVEALLINPQLTDSNTATLTLSVQSDFAGPYTV